MKINRRFYFFIAAFIITLPPFSASVPRISDISQNRGLTVHAQPRIVGMSQIYVDTTVMRALYILNEAQSFSGMNNNQENAIKHAKAILDRLRREAKGDPNEKYALWKISEVEYQINLEEEEVRKIAAEKRLLTANQLVVEYNAEVGKNRPDFAKLRGLHRRMMEVDVRQANRLSESYNKRYRQISREAMSSLEKAINANDLVLAKRELEYCEKNKNFLMISDTRLAEHRTRIERMENSKQEVQRITAELAAGEKAMQEFKLSESRATINRAKNSLNDIRGVLPQKEAAALSARANRALRNLDNREDSLVNVLMSVLNTQGHEAAIEYFNEVLQKRMRISHERASVIDQTILRTGTVKSDDNRPEIVVDFATDQPERSHLLTDMQQTARARAQARADSLRGVALQTSIEIYLLFDRNKHKDAVMLFAKERPFLLANMSKSPFEYLQRCAAQARNAHTGKGPKIDKNTHRANVNTGLIFALMEANRTREAQERFQRNRRALSRHLDRETFETLELTVNSLSKR
ncbi:MAG: hypothetical protein FWE57_04680 [Chitinispirillia bacterium]|nr:hypothetical protein [Chitinispirillia bacterium]